MNEDLTGRRVYQGPVGEGQFLGTIRSVRWVVNEDGSDAVCFLLETDDGSFKTADAEYVRTKP